MTRATFGTTVLVVVVLVGVLVVVIGASFSAGQAPPARHQAPTPAPSGQGVIAGVLVSADKGTPVRRANVRLVRVAPGVTRTTVSDAEGRFTFSDLPAGDYTLSASRPGYLDTVHGARQPGATSVGTPLTLAEDQRIEKLTLPLPRGGVISGVIIDEFGDPAFNTPVRALRFSYQNGERVLTPAGNAVTDDRGAYRMAGLLPGDYLVSAVPRETVAVVAATANEVRQRTAQRIAQAQASGDDRMLATARAEAARIGPPPPPPPATGYVPVYYPGVAEPSSGAAVKLGLSEELW